MGFPNVLWKKWEFCCYLAGQERGRGQVRGGTIRKGTTLKGKGVCKGRRFRAGHSVNIHERDLLKLWSYGALEEVIEGIYVVNDRAQYDENIGLRLDNHWMNEILTI